MTFHVQNTPPAFASTQARPRSALRVQVEALQVGEWLRAGPATEVKGSAGAAAQNARAEFKGERSYTVRKDVNGDVWVGRVE